MKPTTFDVIAFLSLGLWLSVFLIHGVTIDIETILGVIGGVLFSIVTSVGLVYARREKR